MAKRNESQNSIVIANAAGATTAIAFILCRFAFIIAPELSLAISRTWFHGIDISQIAARQMDGFILGLVSATLVGWLVGWLFAVFQNYFDR